MTARTESETLTTELPYLKYRRNVNRTQQFIRKFKYLKCIDKASKRTLQTLLKRNRSLDVTNKKKKSLELIHKTYKYSLSLVYTAVNR